MLSFLFEFLDSLKEFNSFELDISYKKFDINWFELELGNALFSFFKFK